MCLPAALRTSTIIHLSVETRALVCGDEGGGAPFPHLPSDISCVNYQVAPASAWLNICLTTKVNAGEIYGNIFPPWEVCCLLLRKQD